jgi:hypothetical protein
LQDSLHCVRRVLLVLTQRRLQAPHREISQHQLSALLGQFDTTNISVCHQIQDDTTNISVCHQIQDDTTNISVCHQTQDAATAARYSSSSDRPGCGHAQPSYLSVIA